MILDINRSSLAQLRLMLCTFNKKKNITFRKSMKFWEPLSWLDLISFLWLFKSHQYSISPLSKAYCSEKYIYILNLKQKEKREKKRKCKSLILKTEGKTTIFLCLIHFLLCLIYFLHKPDRIQKKKKKKKKERKKMEKLNFEEKSENYNFSLFDLLLSYSR